MKQTIGYVSAACITTLEPPLRGQPPLKLMIERQKVYFNLNRLLCDVLSKYIPLSIKGERRFIHNMIRTPDVSYTNHKNCNVSYTSFIKYRI